MFFVSNSMPSYSLSSACKSCLRCLVKDLSTINSISQPKKIFHLPSPLKGMSSNINEVIRTVLNLLFFLRKDFTHTKSTKSTKSTKNTKSTNTQISE